MKEKFDKYDLKNVNVAYKEGQLYSPYFPKNTKDFAFKIHRGPFKDIWVLIEYENLKLIDKKAIINFKIVNNPNNIPEENFKTKSFLTLLEVVINNMFS